MKSHVQVAVIGGGVVGCSVLYHLTKMGWKDVVLLERDELTSGSTWHAAGGMHTLNADPNVAKLQDYTIRLYKELEEISGQSCGIHITGGYMLAGTPERLDYLRMAELRNRVLGFESELVPLEEVAKYHPVVDTSHFLGALYDPFEGHIDPSGVTNAYAKAARIGGAEVYRFTPVVELNPDGDGGWIVVTPKGNIHAEAVVNAGGLWARELGRMVGLELPVLAMEHQYLITDTMPEVEALEWELPHLIDFEGEIYSRQEGQGMVIDTYEQAGRPWQTETTPMDFGHELLEPDLDRIAPSLEVAFKHFPALERTGIKRVINGPFTFAPDGNPLVGPVPGLRNHYVACGVMAGFSQGGGVGRTLAEWIIEGEPSMDVFAMDVARFGSWTTPTYTRAKVEENYKRRFSITFPNEELPAGRPLKTTPVYDRLRAAGAVFGSAYGLETALWFAPDGVEPIEIPSFRRSNAHGPVGEECHAVRNHVGLMEIAGFAKYEITGPGAEAWLGRVLANRLPREGRLLLSPMLNPADRLMGDFTIGRLGAERFMIFGSGVAEAFHLRWFQRSLPDDGSVVLRALGASWGGFSIAGPKARQLLGRLVREDLSTEAFPFLTLREMAVGPAPAVVGRISFTGELGYEIYVRAEHQLALYESLLQAGEGLGLRHFGGRALNALRLEKSFGGWTREYTPDYTPGEAGLDRFVDLRKNDFVGLEAARGEAQGTPKRRLSTLVVEADDADAQDNEPILRDGKVVGFVTSGGYGHSVDASIALGYVDGEAIDPAATFEVAILGEPRPARLVERPLFDPDGRRMRD